MHGLARPQRLRDQPALVLLRPTPARLPPKDLDHPLAPAPRLTTRRQTRWSGDPLSSRRPRKAALAGWIRIRRKPGVFARLRSFALNILRANGVTNVSEAVYVNALSLDRLLTHGLPKSQN